MFMISNFVFYGRGGEGAKTVAHILAEAAFYEGKEVQAFPEYGPERSGAPLRSYVKISDEKIPNQSTISKADYMVFIDDSLLKQEDMQNDINRMKTKETKFIINSKDSPELENHFVNLDASEISKKHLGKDFANIVLLGALVKLSNIVKFESIEFAIRNTLKSKPELLDKNIAALKEAYDLVSKW